MKNKDKEQYYLDKLVKVLDKYDLRKHTCINRFGNSVIERDIVDELVEENVISHKVFSLTLVFMVILAFWSGYNYHKNLLFPQYIHTDTVQKRVFNLYGEGDLGHELNYYFQTGDTSQFTDYSDKYEPSTGQDIYVLKGE